MISEYKRRISDSGWGKLLLVIGPGVLTAVLTSLGTVGTVWMAMHDDILELKLVTKQIVLEHAAFRQEQKTQDERINSIDKDVYKMGSIPKRTP